MDPDIDVPRRRRLTRAAGAASAVAVLIVAQARPASASAASPPTPTQTLSTGAYTWHVARSKDDMAAGNKEKDATGPLHGEFPVVGIDGTVQLRRWQWGEVAALSADTVTIVSADGYISDYLVGAAASIDPDLDSMAVGEKVTVVGTVDASDRN